MADRAVHRIPLSSCNRTGRIEPNQESGTVIGFEYRQCGLTRINRATTASNRLDSNATSAEGKHRTPRRIACDLLPTRKGTMLAVSRAFHQDTGDLLLNHVKSTTETYSSRLSQDMYGGAA